ncbi:M16 family metallopeptidase [Pigmentiphaga litoralis]|uniref:Zinc protease n=1 Tax=Pigmentiphaga litoralis TaxID=516702 RepID=A0A7Y9LP92_9BURK|nr:pitrilysin family protein [Pigmentiphaga litoralis]NYE26923.1 zinc protease [Pigmentiphaga litoralis]NYE85667.1 zinc protease [Pigmentiphaga litoralis]
MSASSPRHLASRHLASLTLLRLAAAAVVVPAAAFTAPSVLAAQSGPALPKGMTRVTSVEGITEYRLQNGLRVLLAPDASKPTTTVNMTYMVGSRHENYGETGMAHLLEHMLFKGTPTLRNALGEFSRRGLRANGSTWTDRTNYFASFAANEDNLEWYLGWQADAMVNSLIARKDLDTEMTVVRNEMESGENNPFRILMSKMNAVAYQWHNYGKSTIGARSDVENVDISRLQAFYRTYYQPDNAVLIVSGAFDPAKTLTSISRTFGKLPKPKRALPPLYTVEPVQDGERSITLRRTGGTPLVAALYHVPQGSHPDATAVDLLSGILGDNPSGRLYKNLVESRLAAATFGFTFDSHDPGTVMFGAQLASPAQQDAAREAMLKTLESIKTEPITEEELERARTKWLKDWDAAYSDPQKVGVSLSESIAIGDWRTFFLARDRVRAIKLADVQRVAESYLLQSNRTLGAYVPTDAPQRAPAPKAFDLDKELNGYTGDKDYAQAEAFDPTPANLDARTQRKTLDLPNGPVQLALLEKSTRGRVVNARLSLQFGDADSLKGKMDVSRAVSALVYRGTPTLTRQQIDDKFDALRTDVSFAGSGTDLSVNITTTRDNLAPAVALVMDILRNASFPEAQLDEYQRGELASIEDDRQEPDEVARRTLARHGNPWPAGDVRYVQTFEEKAAAINGLKREDLVAFYNQFYGAGKVRFVAVGDFDGKAVEQSLTKGLEGWKTAPSYTRVSDPFHPVEPKQFDLPLPDKANAFYAATMPMPVQDTNADYPALYVANYLLGTSETSRLWTRVREKEGLSYNVRSALNVSLYEPTADWTVYAIYAPSNRAKLETAIKEELARAAKDGFTDAEVKDGIASIMSLRKLTRAQDRAVVRTWAEYLELGRTFAFSADLDRKMQALTTDQVNTVLRKYLKPEAFSSAAAGDFRAK